MTRAPHPRAKNLTALGHTSANEGPPTVASLGVQAHLVPVDLERERQLKDLIASCEMLRTEWERLFQRVIAVLDEEASIARDIDRPSPLSGRD
jgi:hypothetical protein